jgi:guanine deaminase
MHGFIARELLFPLMEEAVRFAEDHVASGGIPFTALVVTSGGRIIGRGVNRVRNLNDATAHAEVEALRDAGRSLGAPDLQGAVLLASGEPCALCYVAALYASVSRVYFAADRHEAAAGGFDYRSSYNLLSIDPTDWTRLQVEKFPVPRSLMPFQNFGRS